MSETAGHSELDLMKMGTNFDIAPYNGGDLDGRSGFLKLDLNEKQKNCMSAFVGNIPALASIATMSNAYVIKFPEGISGSLMQYKHGGLGTPIVGENGIVGHASLQSLSSQAIVLGAFTAMSVASGQYFLSEINNKLGKISLSVDKILEFLYGDKRAELLAEVSFTKYAYENYSFIMEYNEQRIATIIGLQEAKKVAIKDLEFYMSDLDSTVGTKDISDISGLVDRAFQIKDSLELSMQLYTMATILEMYYSQNHRQEYLNYIERETNAYIDKCDKRILADFSSLKIHIINFKDKLLSKPIDKAPLENRVDSLIESLSSGEESELRKSIRSTLQSPNQCANYYVTKSGDAYLKLA